MYYCTVWGLEIAHRSLQAVIKLTARLDSLLEALKGSPFPPLLWAWQATVSWLWPLPSFLQASSVDLWPFFHNSHSPLMTAQSSSLLKGLCDEVEPTRNNSASSLHLSRSLTHSHLQGPCHRVSCLVTGFGNQKVNTFGRLPVFPLRRILGPMWEVFLCWKWRC